jgi:hypothetical protein
MTGFARDLLTSVGLVPLPAKDQRLADYGYALEAEGIRSGFDFPGSACSAFVPHRSYCTLALASAL